MGTKRKTNGRKRKKRYRSSCACCFTWSGHQMVYAKPSTSRPVDQKGLKKPKAEERAKHRDCV